jgi:hypothetical protein
MNLIQRGTTASRANRGKSVPLIIAEKVWSTIGDGGTRAISSANSKIPSELQACSFRGVKCLSAPQTVILVTGISAVGTA